MKICIVLSTRPEIIKLASLIAILVYPTGPLGLTIVEKASFDCEGWSEGDYSILKKCEDMTSDNVAYIFLTFFVAFIGISMLLPLLSLL